MFDSVRVDNIPGVPIVREGPEGRLLAKGQVLIYAKLSGHMGVVGGAGAGLGSQDGAGEEAGGSGPWEHCPLELRSKVGKRCP